MRRQIAQSLKLGLIASALAACGSLANAADERAGGTQVDLQLVVTVDVSRPMDNDEAVTGSRGSATIVAKPALPVIQAGKMNVAPSFRRTSTCSTPPC
jgi:hypothetical protein